MCLVQSGCKQCGGCKVLKETGKEQKKSSLMKMMNVFMFKSN